MPEITGKKVYEAPIGLRLGSVTELTESAGLVNADTPVGTDNAFCNFGECPTS